MFKVSFQKFIEIKFQKFIEKWVSEIYWKSE